MSQTVFSSIDPAASGTELATILNDFKDALMSGLSGTSRPAETLPGGTWVDTTDPALWVFRLYTGSDDVEIFTIDTSSGGVGVSLATDTFVIRKVSADALGPYLDLVKQRIATNGQVLSGDVVGEIRITGRTDSSTNPVVAKIVYTAGENQTTTAFGGTLSFHSTPAGSATLTEHMRFIGGIVETLVPHKINAQQLVSQNVATTATIAQLDGSKAVVEMTGSTTTEIQGINSAHATKQIVIHNRSSATVTLKHNNTGAAAADRIYLPSSEDVELLPEMSATLIYSSADTKWKLLSKLATFSGFTSTTLYGVGSVSVAASSVSITSKPIATRAVVSGMPTFGIINDGSVYAWGYNANGQLGVGDVTPRSSPVAVLGGIAARKVLTTTTNAFAITEDGTAYAWGQNESGICGINSTTPTSSPTAVLGGLKFIKLAPGYSNNVAALGIAKNGTTYGWGNNAHGQNGDGSVTPRSSPVAVLNSFSLGFKDVFKVYQASFAISSTGTLYAWGRNQSGQLGLGDVTSRSSPVSVLGGLSFKKVVGGQSILGLATSGAAYAWGVNTNGQLGLGDVTPRSSPVAVLGGLTFADIFCTPDHISTSFSMFGLTSAGALYAWGVNTSGQLGVGDVNPRSSPVAVLGGLTIKKMVISGTTVTALTTSGSAYSWGSNTSGELGVGDVTPRSSPVAVLGGLTFADIGVGWGVTQSGTLYTWGANTYGQLGLGDVAARSSPVAVLGGFAMEGLYVFGNQQQVAVTPGSQSYIIGEGPCYFGGKYIGKDLSEITISYAN